MNTYVNSLNNDFPVNIQKRIDTRNNCYSEMGIGWIQLIVDLDEQLSQIDPNYSINQIKEKFGALRFYINGDVGDKGSTLIRLAEQKSITICDVCGNSGKLYTAGYHRTRCELHK